MLENHLLALLSKSHSALAQERLQAIDFVQGDVLAAPNAPIERLLFPRSGLVSIVVELEEGDQIETAMVGCCGALGGAAVFGAKHHIHRAVAQISGRGWSMRTEDAMELADISAEFRQLLMAQEQYLLAQARQTAACNAKHVIMRRLCSWLVRAHNEAGGGELLITQENLAKMLGVQRASVSMFASQLQQKGLIGYRRGRVQISDLEGLRASACECHETLQQQHACLFPDNGVNAGPPKDANAGANGGITALHG
jgi:CRP-like cAMP-binding protein